MPETEEEVRLVILFPRQHPSQAWGEPEQVSHAACAHALRQLALVVHHERGAGIMICRKAHAVEQDFRFPRLRGSHHHRLPYMRQGKGIHRPGQIPCGGVAPLAGAWPVRLHHAVAFRPLRNGQPLRTSPYPAHGIRPFKPHPSRGDAGRARRDDPSARSRHVNQRPLFGHASASSIRASPRDASFSASPSSRASSSTSYSNASEKPLR